MSQLHSIEVSRIKWKLLIWTPIIIGTIVFSIFSSTFFIPKEYLRSTWYSSIGLLLVGWGFGLAYARLWKIRGIDK